MSVTIKQLLAAPPGLRAEFQVGDRVFSDPVVALAVVEEFEEDGDVSVDSVRGIVASHGCPSLAFAEDTANHVGYSFGRDPNCILGAGRRAGAGGALTRSGRPAGVEV